MIPDTYPKRITLLVADAARSRRFYEHGLGLPVWYDDRVPVEGDRLPIRGVTGGTDSGVAVGEGDGHVDGHGRSPFSLCFVRCTPLRMWVQEHF